MKNELKLFWRLLLTYCALQQVARETTPNSWWEIIIPITMKPDRNQVQNLTVVASPLDHLYLDLVQSSTQLVSSNSFRLLSLHIPHRVQFIKNYLEIYMVFQNLVFLDSKQSNLNTMGYKCIFPISPIFSKIHIYIFNQRHDELYNCVVSFVY